MLSPAQVVATRKAIESMYSGTCDVVEYTKAQQPDKLMKLQEVTVLTAQPCRLSFKTKEASSPSDTVSGVNQVIQLFISPELHVKPGSKIVVTQNGVTTAYKSSGQPAIYNTHQEIILELFRGWA